MRFFQGLHHWRVIWSGIWSLECYLLRTESGAVIVDPIESGDLGLIDTTPDIRAVVVTSGWHERSSRLFGKRTGAPVFVPEEDLCMFEDLGPHKTYKDGDTLPGNLRAIGVPGLTRGEQALFSDSNGGTLFVADCLGTTAKWAPGGMPLGGHPNGHPVPKETLSTSSTSISSTSAQPTAMPSLETEKRSWSGSSIQGSPLPLGHRGSRISRCQILESGKALTCPSVWPV